MKLLNDGKVILNTPAGGKMAGHQCTEMVLEIKDMEFLYNLDPSILKSRIGHMLTRFKYHHEIDESEEEVVVDHYKPKGAWVFKRSYGIPGFVCRECDDWVNAGLPKHCKCDDAVVFVQVLKGNG